MRRAKFSMSSTRSATAVTQDQLAARRKGCRSPDKAEVPRNESSTDAADFLKQLRPSGRWVLTAINPVNDSIRTVTADNAKAVHEFIRTYDGEWNLYFSVNPTRTPMSKKAEKVDIAAVEYIFGDLDP